MCRRADEGLAVCLMPKPEYLVETWCLTEGEGRVFIVTFIDTDHRLNASTRSWSHNEQERGHCCHPGVQPLGKCPRNWLAGRIFIKLHRSPEYPSNQVYLKTNLHFQELFKPFGHIARIFLAKDKMTGQCKVFEDHCSGYFPIPFILCSIPFSQSLV